MRVQLEILRRPHGAAEARFQRLWVDVADENATVATALTAINLNPALTDVDGAPVGHVYWECSCLQKKCGACAMRVNGVPGLACDARLSALKGPVRLEPLKKFPVVADLIVDRSLLHENLKAMRVWLEEDARVEEDETADLGYEASRCLQCGCCLEVCPNFIPDGMFAGTAALPPLARLIAELPLRRRRELYRTYARRVFSGCGKSLACRDVCPAGIDIERLLVNSNAVALWKRLLAGK